VVAGFTSGVYHSYGRIDYYQDGDVGSRILFEDGEIVFNVFVALTSAGGGLLSANGTPCASWGAGNGANFTVYGLTVHGYTENTVAIGNTGTSKTISITSGTVQSATLTGNCTFTMPTATPGQSFVFNLYTGSGGFTATFTGVKWPDNAAPAVVTTASRMVPFTFWVPTGESQWFGQMGGAYTP
jgi:hypothetical protein